MVRAEEAKQTRAKQCGALVLTGPCEEGTERECQKCKYHLCVPARIEPYISIPHVECKLWGITSAGRVMATSSVTIAS